MCLKDSKRIGVEPGGKKVYKFLVRKKDDPEGLYRSPYYDHYWRTGEVSTKCEMTDHTGGFVDLQETIKTLKYIRYVNEIKGGGYHSYQTLDGALYDGAGLYMYWSTNEKRVFGKSDIVIAECTIPDDCEYVFEGWCGDNASYVSEKIRLDRVIETMTEEWAIKLLSQKYATKT